MIWEIVCSVARLCVYWMAVNPTWRSDPRVFANMPPILPHNPPVSQEPLNVWSQKGREYRETQIMVGLKTVVTPVSFPHMFEYTFEVINR